MEFGYSQSENIVVFTYNGTRYLFGGPSGRSGSVRMLQTEEVTTGGARVVYPPWGAVHTMQFDYNAVNSTDRDGFISFFDTVDARAKTWTYTEAVNNDTVVCRFRDPWIGYEERYLDISRISFALEAQASFFTASSVPGIAQADTVITRLYMPLSVRRERQQPSLRFTDGSLAVFNKSALRRDTRALSLPYRTRAELAAIIAFYCYSARGGYNPFSWTLDGVVKTVRFSAEGLSWTQPQNIADELYEVTCSVEEEV